MTIQELIEKLSAYPEELRQAPVLVERKMEYHPAEYFQFGVYNNRAVMFDMEQLGEFGDLENPGNVICFVIT